MYNGWANYETWNINLWITNDYDLYHIMLEQGRQKPFTSHTAKVLAHHLFPDGTPDMKTKRAYAHVNWKEVAEAWNE